MVRRFAGSSMHGRDDGAVTRVIIMANGERAFSAGGDIRALYDLGKAGEQGGSAAVLCAKNIRSTQRSSDIPSPISSLIDGIVMGGGVGISVHGSHRVAGDKYQFAMPEVGIGFFPDVGATWALPRLARRDRHLLALTGERLKTADAVASGAATHHVRSDRFADLRDALCGAVPVDAVLAAFAEPRGQGDVTKLGAGHRSAVCVRPGRGHPGGARSGSAIRIARMPVGRRRPPTRCERNRRLSLKLALAQMSAGRNAPLTNACGRSFGSCRGSCMVTICMRACAP